MARAMAPPSSAVDAYLKRCPAEARGRLEQLRAVVRATVPDATEVISYQMPGYCYPGYDYKGMFVWFALQRHHVGLYLRPPTIADHRPELRKYGTTKSAVHLPLDEPLPVGLIRTLVRASVRNMKRSGRKLDRAPGPRTRSPGRTTKAARKGGGRAPARSKRLGRR